MVSDVSSDVDVCSDLNVVHVELTAGDQSEGLNTRQSTCIVKDSQAAYIPDVCQMSAGFVQVSAHISAEFHQIDDPDVTVLGIHA